jgi:hypothetical protein
MVVIQMDTKFVKDVGSFYRGESDIELKLEK